MNYIKISPYYKFGRFWAKIERDNPGDESFVIPDMSISVVARKNDGTYETKTFQYPSDVMDEDDIRIDMFALYETEYAQIIAAKINSFKIGVSYMPTTDFPDISFRYDDSVFYYPEFVKSPIKLDFQILDTNDPKVLLVADNSMWGILKGVDAIIEITIPNSTEPVTHYFGKHRINSFNSITLGINCVQNNTAVFQDLPDGVYHIVVKAAGGKEEERYYLRTNQLRLKIDQTIINCELDCETIDEGIADNIEKMEIYLEGAHAHLRAGNIEKAYYYYSLADALSEKCGC